MKYIGVIVPLPLVGTFTYAVPEEWESQVRVGVRVIVPFGKKKLYTAIVAVLHTHKPEAAYEFKEIICILDPQPILRFPQLKFWDWISAYYQAYLGDVFQAAIPSGLKLQSETLICINPDFEAETILSDKEQRILDALSDGNTLSVN
jgi:primosomal protein N' (replication factor Y)